MSTATLPAAGPIGLHHRAFWRFAWKEYRMLRGFWLAVAVLTVMIQLIALGTLPFGDERASLLFSVALGATVLYAVGAAATLFAVEHEEETYDLLTTLPVEWPPAFFGKLFVAVTSSLGLLVVLVGITFALGGTWNNDVAYLLLPAIAEVIAWGIFMSLTIRRPLVAAVATIAVVSAQVNLVISLMSDHSIAIEDPETYPSAVAWRLAISFVVLLVDLTLGRDWLRVTKIKPSEAVPRSQATAITVPSQVSCSVSKLKMMSRLLWQTWRESRVAMCLTVVGLIALGAFLSAASGGFALLFRGYGDSLIPIHLYCLVAGAIYGSGVFASDQRQSRYRFLAAHAASPRVVWISRQLIWAGLLAILAAIPTALGLFSKGHLIAFPFSLALGYVAGQFCSMFFRRQIIAGFAATILAFVLFAGMLVILAFQLPLYWIAALPMLLLLATWLRTSDWLVERNRFRSWAKCLGPLTVAVLGMVALTPSIRLGQVPLNSVERKYYDYFSKPNPTYADWMEVVTGEKMPHFDEAAARAAGDELVRLAETIDMSRGQNIKSQSSISKWQRLKRNKYAEQIESVIEISKTRVCLIPVFQIDSPSWQRLRDLDELLKCAALVELEDGKLDAALGVLLARVRILGHIERTQSIPLLVARHYPVPQRDSDIYSRAWFHKRRGYYGYGFVPMLDDAMGDLAAWAGSPAQSQERLKHALSQLDKILPSSTEQWEAAYKSDEYLPPYPTAWTDFELLRQVVVGDAPPFSMEDARQSRTMPHSLPFLANQIPFEQERSLKVISVVAAHEQERIETIREIAFSPRKNSSPELSKGAKQTQSDWELNWHPQFRSSFLLFQEFQSRGLRENLHYFNQMVAGNVHLSHALKATISITAYKIEHAEYPGLLVKGPEGDSDFRVVSRTDWWTDIWPNGVDWNQIGPLERSFPWGSLTVHQPFFRGSAPGLFGVPFDALGETSRNDHKDSTISWLMPWKSEDDSRESSRLDRAVHAMGDGYLYERMMHSFFPLTKVESSLDSWLLFYFNGVWGVIPRPIMEPFGEGGTN